ncbi:MAG: SET domain-containing protein-lysine N-methyltransferase [Opitutales bacterium]|nr:SET domain-containing protein-lysine N-methyltransferase [Opitutales bacterium]
MAETVPQKMYEVKKSEIHGFGLFASRDIKKGERVLKYLGEKISKEESARRGLEQERKAKRSGEGAVYIFELDGEFDIDGNFEYNDARFINHACSTNCEAVCEGGEIWFFAKCDIKKGEELLYDYGYALEHFFRHPCRCGKPNCAGYIVAEADRLKLKKILARTRKNKRARPSAKRG